MGQFAQPLVVVEHLGGAGRNVDQGLGDAGFGFVVERPPGPAQRNGQTGQDGQLRGEGLGRGDPHFRSGIGLQHQVGFAGNGRFRHVDDGDDRLTLFAGIAQRRQGVRRFPRLRDEQRHTIFGHEQVAVAELGGDIHLHRNAGQAFDPIARHHGGIIGRAAGDEGQATDCGRVEGQFRQGHRTIGGIDETVQGVADNLRLFVNFLEHEVAVLALADGRPRHGR